MVCKRVFSLRSVSCNTDQISQHTVLLSAQKYNYNVIMHVMSYTQNNNVLCFFFANLQLDKYGSKIVYT